MYNNVIVAKLVLKMLIHLKNYLPPVFPFYCSYSSFKIWLRPLQNMSFSICIIHILLYDPPVAVVTEVWQPIRINYFLRSEKKRIAKIEQSQSAFFWLYFHSLVSLILHFIKENTKKNRDLKKSINVMLHSSLTILRSKEEMYLLG